MICCTGRKKLFHVFLLVMMGRISENVTAVALSEIRPKFFLGAYLAVTSSTSYGFAVMHPPAQSCDFAGTLFYCLSPAPQAVPQAAGFSAGFSAGLSPAPQAEPQAAGFSAGLSPAPQAEPQAVGFSAGLSPAPQAAAGAASAFLFQPKRLERDILIDLHLFRQTAFPVCNAIVTFCFSEKKYAQIDD